MRSKLTIYDAIVIGGGPSGMMAAISAASGTPMTSLKKKSIRSVLIIEKSDLGGISRYGMMGLTRKWFIPGMQLVNNLIEEVNDLKIPVVLKEEVILIETKGKIKKIITDKKKEYRAKTVIIATGIFPYSRLLMDTKIKLLTDTFDNQEKYLRAILSKKNGKIGINRLTNFFHRKKDKYAFITDNSISTKTERIIKKIIPAENLEIIDNKFLGSSFLNSKKNYKKIFIDYGSFKRNPGSITYLLDQKLKMKDGYIWTNSWGETNISGIYACGNVIFPVSGVLQALYSGFVAGLGVYNFFFKKKRMPSETLFPWLY